MYAMPAPHRSNTYTIDAEECWIQLTDALRDVSIPGPSTEGSTLPRKFVDQYMTGEMRRE